MLASKRMMLSPLSGSHSLSHALSDYASNAIPFSQMQKAEVYCGIITTHLVVSERLAKDGLSMQ